MRREIFWTCCRSSSNWASSRVEVYCSKRRSLLGAQGRRTEVRWRQTSSERGCQQFCVNHIWVHHHHGDEGFLKHLLRRGARCVVFSLSVTWTLPDWRPTGRTGVTDRLTGLFGPLWSFCRCAAGCRRPPSGGTGSRSPCPLCSSALPHTGHTQHYSPVTRQTKALPAARSSSLFSCCACDALWWSPDWKTELLLINESDFTL